MSENQPNPVQPRCVCGGAGPKLTTLAEMLLPSGEAAAHFRQAHLEVLKGLRALLDQRIESMSSQAGTGYKVDVE
jgi:hypothetical protein